MLGWTELLSGSFTERIELNRRGIKLVALNWSEAEYSAQRNELEGSGGNCGEGVDVAKMVVLMVRKVVKVKILAIFRFKERWLCGCLLHPSLQPAALPKSMHDGEHHHYHAGTEQGFSLCQTLDLVTTSHCQWPLQPMACEVWARVRLRNQDRRWETWRCQRPI